MKTDTAPARDGWRARLIEAMDHSGLSDRAISSAAGLSPNYVNQIRRHGKAPGVNVVVQICAALRVSAVYIFTGAKLDAEAEEALSLYSQLSDRDRQIFLDFLRRLPVGEPHQEPKSSAHQINE